MYVPFRQQKTILTYAWAEDETIEIIENVENDGRLRLVQFHQEEDLRDPDYMALFHAVVEYALVA